MQLDRMLARRITGVRPFNELPIDAEIWREAHSHHHLHRQLHAVTAHRPGIVWGLEVIASRTKERTIVVAPGVAIDTDGQTVVLAEPVSFTLEDTRQIYVILSFLRAVDRASAISVSGGQQYYREVEGRDLKPVKELPHGAYVELARLYRSSAHASIIDAPNPFSPGSDEVNLLYRVFSYPHCHADIGVGELAYVPSDSANTWNPNRVGLCHLLREAGRDGLHLTFTGPFNLRAPASSSADPTLLYVAGKDGFQALADAEVDGLSRFLDGGGTLLAEPAEADGPFAQNLNELIVRLGANLRPLEKGHPLLTSHHVFAAPPPGGHSNGGTVLGDSDMGLFVSTMNYGAVWQGEVDHANTLAAREHIRQAMEFGMNFAAYAARRRRLIELSRLG